MSPLHQDRAVAVLDGQVVPLTGDVVVILKFFVIRVREEFDVKYGELKGQHHSLFYLYRLCQLQVVWIVARMVG